MGNSSEYTPTQRFLRHLIEANADERTLSWITQREEKLREEYSEQAFYLAFGSVSRFAPKQPLVLHEAQQEEANQLRSGFRPGHWDLRHALRAYLLLLLPAHDSLSTVAVLTRLLETADVDEQIAMYQSLPLLPHPESFVALATNGLRTNITLVFDAIALRNPYPATYLDEAAWNQLVLKAVFMNRPLYLIYGADQRTNPVLARILVDFAHERWAAGRPVNPELWRFVAPYLNPSHQPDLERVIASDNPWEQAAGLLACQQSNQPTLQDLCEHSKDKPETITGDERSWQRIGEAHARESE